MLKRYIPLLLVVVVVIAVACTKGKVESTPSIKVKSLSTTEVFPNQVLEILLEYTDKEGDLGTGTLSYVRNRLNAKPITDAASNDKADSITQILPEFPKSSVGDIVIRIEQQFMSEDPFENDTMNFKIYVKDIAGNVSDTIITDPVVEIQD